LTAVELKVHQAGGTMAEFVEVQDNNKNRQTAVQYYFWRGWIWALELWNVMRGFLG
jgi:hypothetical protein